MIVRALAFVCGDLLLQHNQQLPPLFMLLILSGFAAIMARLRYTVLLFFCLGFLFASVFAHYQLNQRLSPDLENIPLIVRGEISNLPEQNSHRASFEFSVKKSTQKLPEKLKLTWYEPTAVLHAGEIWQFSVKLKRPHANFNLGGMDYERWLFTQNIGATGTITKVAPIFITPAGFSFNALRQTISDKLTQLYDDTINTALLRALTVGDDNGLTRQNWQTFQKTGVTHLIVISGSHIALVAGLVYFLTLKLWTYLGVLKISPPKAAALASLLTAIFYASLAGYVIPTKRAVIMLGLVALASFYQRQFSHQQSFALALFGMLIFNPTMLLSIGFWLSFLAVALILFRVAGRLKSPSNWKNAVDIQLTVSLGLSPLLLFFFNQTSLISPLVNFIAVPIVEIVVVPLALVQIPLMWLFPYLADKIFSVLDFILHWLMYGLELAEKLPYAVFDLPQPSVFTLLLSSLGIVWLFAPRGIPARFLGVILNLPLLLPLLPTLEKGETIVTVLDVGQGLAISVQTQNHQLLYDTGARFQNGGDMGKNVILPFFRYHGIQNLDTLIISHSDNDHSGGAYSVLSEMDNVQILTSAPEKLIPYQTKHCESGQNWTWDNVNFEILSPAKTFEKDNNNSCVLKIETGQNAILLTGDIEAVAENWLVENMPKKLQAKVLVAPHHGSKTSSTLNFLNFVRPETVLISAGYQNQFHHPSKEVVARYVEIHAPALNTANDGALTVRLKPDDLKIESLRAVAGKYWHFR